MRLFLPSSRTAVNLVMRACAKAVYMKNDNKSNDNSDYESWFYFIQPEKNESFIDLQSSLVVDADLLEAAEEESKREEETGEKNSNPFWVFCLILSFISLLGYVVAAIVLLIRYL